MADPVQTDAPPSEAVIQAALANAPPSKAQILGAVLPKRLGQWSQQIVDASSHPPAGVTQEQWGSVIAAVMDRESNGVNVGIGSDGHGHGLMQIDDRYHEFASTPDAADPSKNVAYGAGLLKDLFEKLPSDMAFEDKVQHAAAAYNAGPAHLKSDEPDAGTTGNDYGSDVLDRSKNMDFSVLAQAAVSGPSPEEAGQNLTVAQATGLPVGVVAADPVKAQQAVQQANLKVQLSGAPAVATFAAQSLQHAALVKDEAPTLGWLNRWFLGTTQLQPVPDSARGPYADRQRAQGGEPTTDIPSVVASAFARGGAVMRYEYEGFKEYLMRRMVQAQKAGPDAFDAAQGAVFDAVTAKDEQELNAQHDKVQFYRDLADSKETPAEAQSAKFPQTAIKGAIGLTPYLASGPLSPAVLTAQAIGHLTAEGVDPDRAAGYGVAAGLLGTIGAEKVVEGLGSAAEALGVSKLVSGLSTKLAVLAKGSPELAKLAASKALPEGVHTMANGWAMTVLTGYTEKLALIRDQAIKAGRSVDPSEYVRAGEETLSDANRALPFLALLGGAHVMGRFVEAHANAAAHDALTAPLKGSKLPDEELRSLVREMIDQRRVRNLLSVAHDEAQVRGGDVQGYSDALDRVSYRFIDPEHFDRTLQAAGEDPSAWAARASGDGGASYRFAKDVGGLFRVPTENYLVDLRQWHEQLREGVAADPDGATLSRDGGDELVRRMTEEVNKPLDNGELQKIMARGLGRTPTEAEINATLGNLRGLGFEIPELPAIKVGGTGEAYEADLYRGVVKGRDPSEGRDRFFAPDEAGARMYAGEDGTVAKERIKFSNMLRANNWVDAKAKLGLPADATMPQLLEGARKAGHDGLTFKTKSGDEYVDLREPPVKTEPPTYGSSFAQKLYVDMQVRMKPIDELRAIKGQYKAAATRAQTSIDRKTTATVNLLASAEQSAQQGIDEALGAAEKGRSSAVALKTADLVTVRRLTSQIRAAVTQSRMAGIDPTSIPDDVAGTVNEAIKKAANAAVKSAKVDPATVKKIVSEQVKLANSEFQSSLAGSKRAKDKSEVATGKTVEAGDNAAEIETLKKQRDLNRAMDEAKTAALKRADASASYLKGMTDNATREALYNNKASGHPEYGWGYDLIMEALNLRRKDASYRPSDFSEVSRTLIDNGEVLGFNAEHIRSLLAQPRGVGDLTVDELANVENAIKSLAHLASERSKAYIEGKVYARQQVILNDVGPAAAALASAPRAPARRVSGKIMEAFGGDQDRLDAAFSDFHTMLAQLGRWGGSQESRFIDVRYKENQNLARYAKLFEAMPKDLKKLGDTDVPTPEWMPKEAVDAYGGDGFVKRRDVWYAILRSGTEEGLSNLARSWGVEPAQVVEWLHTSATTHGEWEFFKSWWKNAEEVGDMEQALDSNRAGVPMVRKTPRKITTPLGEEITGGYAPERWHRETEFLPAKSEQDPTSGIRAMNDTENGFLKALQPNVKLIADISFDNLPAHVRGIAKDLAMGDFVRDQARMLNDPLFKEAVAPLGPDYYNALVRWHNTVATGQMQQSFDALTRHIVVTAARGYSARAIFNLNFKVAAGLLGHLPFAKAVEGGEIDISAGIRKALFDSAARDYATANSKVLGYRSERWLPKLRETEQAILGEDAALPGAQAFRAPSMYMWHAADSALGQIIYHGIREVALSKGMSVAEADAHADLHLDRLMPSMDVYGKAAIASNPWIGMWVLARNFESTVWNVKARAEVQNRLGIADGSVQGWARYHAQMLGTAAALGLGYYAFSGHGRNEQEQSNGWLGWGQMAGRTMIEHYTYGSYLLHLAAQNFAGMLVGEGVPKVDRLTLFDTPEHSQAQQLVHDLGVVTKNCVASGSPSKALLGGLDAGARFLGAGQILKSGVGAARVAKYRIFDQNDFKATPQTYVGDAGKIWYGDVDKYDSNILSDADHGLGAFFDSLWRK